MFLNAIFERFCVNFQLFYQINSKNQLFKLKFYKEKHIKKLAAVYMICAFKNTLFKKHFQLISKTSFPLPLNLPAIILPVISETSQL